MLQYNDASCEESTHLTKEARFFFLRFIKSSFDLDNHGQIKFNENGLFCN